MAMDTFICGSCQNTFHDINLFIVHKNSQCAPLVETSEEQHVTHVIEEQHATQIIEEQHATQIIEEQHATQIIEEQQATHIITEVGPKEEDFEQQHQQQAETITVIHQAPDGSSVITGDQVMDGEQQMCYIQVNEHVPDNGGTSKIHLVPFQKAFDGQNLTHDTTATLTSESGNIQLIFAEPPEVEVKPARRRPGRPKRGQEKHPKAAPPPKEPKERPEPEINEDGKMRCPRCKKTFGRERHFHSHKCLAYSDYVDTMQKEVLSADEASEEDDEKDHSDTYRLPNAPRRGRPPKRRTLATVVIPPSNGTDVPPEGADMVPPESDQAQVVEGSSQKVPRAARQHDTKKVDMDLPVSKEQIANIPVFADEEEKLEFEETLNVDLSEVDTMYKTHVIDQNVNEHAPPPASRTATELSVFSCNVCDKVFKTVSHMRLHCLIHTNLKPFKCTKCTYSSNSKGNLYTHMRIHTGQFYTCSVCSFQSPNKTHLVEHLAIHSKIRHKCAICKKDYNTVKSLINHIRKYHIGKAGKEYLEKFQGKHHQGTAVLHQCHICLRKFKKKIDRDRHLFVHNIRGLPDIYECDLCDFSATRRYHLEQHFQKHRVIYVCAECGGKFPSSVRLNQHLAQVHGVMDSSENWMEVFNNCIANSLFLPEPDGSTNSLFDEPAETEQAAHVLETGAEPGSEELAQKAVLTEAVQILTEETTVHEITDNQKDPLVVTQETNPATITEVPPQNEQLKDEDQSVMESQQVVVQQVEGTDGLDPVAVAVAEATAPGDQCPGAADDQGVVDNGEGVEGEDALEDALEDEEEEDLEGMGAHGPDISQEALELENAQDYDIYKRLNYAQMSMAVFQKFRMTFGNEECEFCGRLFYSKVDFTTHFRSHTGERPFPCEQCSYRASSKDALKRHVEKEHDKVTYVCQQCEFVASSRTQLWHHQQRHKEPQELKCTTCEITFPSAKRLKAHLSVRHPGMDKALVKKMLSASQKPQGKLGRRSHKCPYCSKTFMRGSSDLQKHIWIHQGIKPFKCNLCPHACRSKNNLMTHMMRHSPDKPFLCNDCGKAYKSRTALRWHVRTHKEGKIFRCVKCNYEAVQYSHLKRHMQTHDVVKRFVCEHCDYSANTVGYMKIHYTRNHKGKEYKENPNPAPQMAPGTKVYRCLSCDYLFGNLSDIKRHLKVRHHVSVEDIHALDNIESDQPSTVELSAPASAPAVIQPSAPDLVAAPIEVVPQEDVQQQVPQSEVQVVEMMDTGAPATSEEQDASTALQSLQFSVPQGNMDAQTASAVSILQQIIGMSKHGAFTGQQQITVQSEDGQSYVAVNPDTIIVQDSDELVIAGDGQEGEQQYVIQYVTQPPAPEDGAMGGEVTEVANTEVVTEGHQLVDQQVVEMEMGEEYVGASTQEEENMHVIMEGQDSVQITPGADTMEVPVHIYTDVGEATAIEEHTVTTEIVAES